MEIGALETVMEEWGAVGWAWSVQLEQQQLKVAGGDTGGAGQAGPRLADWPGDYPVRDQSTQCLHSQGSSGVQARAQMGRPGSISPPHLLPGKLLWWPTHSLPVQVPQETPAPSPIATHKASAAAALGTCCHITDVPLLKQPHRNMTAQLHSITRTCPRCCRHPSHTAPHCLAPSGAFGSDSLKSLPCPLVATPQAIALWKDPNRPLPSGPLLSFSRSVVSDSLRPHGLQHVRLPCPSTSPRACSNSCPLSWWYHPTISFSGLPVSCSKKLLALSNLSPQTSGTVRPGPLGSACS